jgi:acetyltransferase-like isoleucine patch superfamily enzyme
VTIAEDASIGANVVLHDGVDIGSGARVDDGAILGRVAPPSNRNPDQVIATGPTAIGEGAVICTHAVVHAGAEIGARAFVGDNSCVREGARLGADAAVGYSTLIKPNVVFGDRARTQAQCVIGANVVVEEDVFFGPGVIVLVGRLMTREERLPPPAFRRGSQIGAGATILPGVEVGENGVVGAGAVVTSSVPAGVVVRGIPAQPGGGSQPG